MFLFVCWKIIYLIYCWDFLCRELYFYLGFRYGGGGWSLFLKEKFNSRFDGLFLCFKYVFILFISFKMFNEKESNVYVWMYMCNRVLK